MEAAALASKRADVEKRVAIARQQQQQQLSQDQAALRESSGPILGTCVSREPAGRRKRGSVKFAVAQSRCDVSSRIFDLAWSPGNTHELLAAGEDGLALYVPSEAGGPPKSRLQFTLPISGGESSQESQPAPASSSARKPSWLTAGERAHSHGDTPPAGMRLAWQPDGRQFLSGSDDGHVAVWDARDGRRLGGFDAAECTSGDDPNSEVYGLSMLSRDSLLAVGCLDSVQQCAGWSRSLGLDPSGTSG